MTSRRFTLEDLQRKGFQVSGNQASKLDPEKPKANRKVIGAEKRKLGTLDAEIPNRVNIKPLSVNECWQGERFKTDNYLSYEKELLWLLQPIELPEKPYKISFTFGFSNKASDWDNPVKPLQDILQKRYHFDDKDIVEAYVRKIKVRKGEEYFEFKLETSNKEP